MENFVTHILKNNEMMNRVLQCHFSISYRIMHLLSFENYFSFSFSITPQTNLQKINKFAKVT